MIQPPSFPVRRGERGDFLRLVELISSQFTGRVHFSEPVQRSLPSGDGIRPDCRLDFVFAGRKHMRYPTRRGIVDAMLEPGEIHYCPPMTWKEPRWDQLHVMSSLVFNPQFIRITYIDYRELSNRYAHAGADIFYHTAGPLCEPGQAVLRALNLFAAAPATRRQAAASLFTALFSFTRETLLFDQNRTESKRDHTRERILQYLHENFRSPISRESVAAHFSLNPRYISQLFHAEVGGGFSATLRQLRLEYAAVLLQNTPLTIDEITVQCGYASSTYFIAAFRKFFNMTPGEFRKRTE